MAFTAARTPARASASMQNGIGVPATNRLAIGRGRLIRHLEKRRRRVLDRVFADKTLGERLTLDATTTLRHGRGDPLQELLDKLLDPAAMRLLANDADVHVGR